LKKIANSIVRDRIANMTLSDILKNRSKIRNGVKEEMQKILTGWGIWLETIEIQDVKISSSKLFKNLQTEFRESSRMQAEKITEDSNLKIEQDRLEREKRNAKTRADAEIREFTLRKKDDLKKMEQGAKFHESQIKVERQNLITEIEQKINAANREHEYDLNNKKNTLEKDLRRIEFDEKDKILQQEQ